MQTLQHTANAFIVRLVSVAVYVAALRHCGALAAVLRCNPILFRELMGLIKRERMEPSAFVIFLLFLSIMLPVVNTLTAEISSDTIWFLFGICQGVYCVADVSHSIMRVRRAPAAGEEDDVPLGAIEVSEGGYSRERPIPLEESLLLTKEHRGGGVVSGLAVGIGFLLTFSRVEGILSVAFLHAVGFLLYFYVPRAAERSGLVLSTPWSCLYALAALGGVALATRLA